MSVDEKIKAVLFDFGNVICIFDNMKTVRRLAEHTDMEEQKIEWNIYHASGLQPRYEKGEISSDEFYQSVKTLCGLDMSKEEFRDAYTDIFTPIPETCELIKRLRPGYKLGLVSDTSEWDFGNFQPPEVMALFDAMTLSFQVRTMKPDSRMYQDILYKMKLPARQCVYIDDKYPNVEKARWMGFHAIQYFSPERLLRDLKEQGLDF